MKIVHIIDSLEINGGSMMCFEMASAMRREFKDCQIECLVVSKTGEYGRKKITAKKFAQFYGWEMPSIKYDEFYKKSCEYKDCIILHHRLECTRPLKFKIKPFLYLVINHTVQSLNRLKKFSNADLVVSVCKYLRERSPALNVPHKVILNGISYSDEYEDDLLTRRSIVYTLQFTVKSYVYGPVTDAAIIRKATVFESIGDFQEHKRTLRYDVEAQALEDQNNDGVINAADNALLVADDDFGFNEGITLL